MVFRETDVWKGMPHTAICCWTRSLGDNSQEDPFLGLPGHSHQMTAYTCCVKLFLKVWFEYLCLWNTASLAPNIVFSLLCRVITYIFYSMVACYFTFKIITSLIIILAKIITTSTFTTMMTMFMFWVFSMCHMFGKTARLFPWGEEGTLMR